jgi:MoaA/NifB/PqqE/SkfB family radical SAM enzyme
VDYSAYEKLYPILEKAEQISTDNYDVVIKWSKIGDAGTRSYKRCYGPPFMIQISGSGLVAPCGMLFNDKYAKFHIGNIVEDSWYDIWQSDRYWEVMSYLGSDNFNAQSMCGSLCLQHKVNEALDGHMNHGRRIVPATGKQPMHINFV